MRKHFLRAGLVLWILGAWGPTGTTAPQPTAPATQDAGADRIHTLDVELVGPLEAIRVPGEVASWTELTLPLAPGERRRLRVPVVTRSGGAGAVPEVQVLPKDGGGSCAQARWVEGQVSRDSWPVGLRIRPVPGVESPSPRASLGVLTLILLGGIACLSLRRRPIGVVVVGLIGAGLGAERAWQGGRGTEEVLVHEGDGGAWSRVRVASRRLELAPGEPAHLSTRPPDASLRIHGAFPAGGGAVAEPHWTVVGPVGCSLISQRRWDPGPLVLEPGRNAWGDLEECFLRGGDGQWTAHGSWPLGSPLPAPVEGGQGVAPPGGMNPALPLGRSVFLGRLRGGSELRPEGDELPRGDRRSWVRWVGFGP